MVLVDVRTPAEYEMQHADGAMNLPVELIASGQLPDIEKDAEIGTYCRSGARSEQAMQLLMRAGYSNVTNLGGLSDVI